MVLRLLLFIIIHLSAINTFLDFWYCYVDWFWMWKQMGDQKLKSRFTITTNVDCLMLNWAKWHGSSRSDKCHLAQLCMRPFCKYVLMLYFALLCLTKCSYLYFWYIFHSMTDKLLVSLRVSSRFMQSVRIEEWRT